MPESNIVKLAVAQAPEALRMGTMVPQVEQNALMARNAAHHGNFHNAQVRQAHLGEI
jgi:hypothetical protein